MASQLDLYIEQGMKEEATNDVELNLYAELTEGNNGSESIIRAQEVLADEEELESTFSRADIPQASSFVESVEQVVHQGSRVISSGWDNPTNWWLALIAFLLFLQIWFKE